MKKLRVAIIGQGRSGRDIHGAYFKSEMNEKYEVAYIVEKSESRRAKAQKEFGCTVLSDVSELYDKKDIDLVVNASFSQMHYAITKDLLSHGFNVLCEKPFGRTVYEGMDLINTAKANGVTVTAFQQSLYAPDFTKVKELIASGKIGKVLEICIRYQSFARRWDWQTLQSFCAGTVYNTGPHPIGQALSLLGWDDNARVVFSSLSTAITSGDAEDYSKIIISTPNGAFADIEMTSTDGFADGYRFKIIGTKGSIKIQGSEYFVKYLDTDKVAPVPLDRCPLSDAEGNPMYCGEKLDITEESGSFTGSSFDSAVDKFYTMLYGTLAEGKPLEITPEMATKVVGIIEKCHADNPLCVRFDDTVEYPN
ncbi:MAG: Gfo/Idh/MocA family oxidoreductase [Clostridia bacterium]|nr:Gfo/Idh/MocA family oxidoreductase [Clostridia bacterium]